MATQSPTLDLSGCDTEAVHVPGAIQPHGLLLVLEPDSLTIVAASANAERFLGCAAAELIGRCVVELPGVLDAEQLAAALRRADLEDGNPFELRLEWGGTLDAIAHRHAGRLILECERAHGDAPVDQAYFYNRVRGSLVRLRGAASLRQVCEQTAVELRALTGFDRVLVYAFLPDWTGEVVAEAAFDEPRYLGLRFPASDIPSQARALYGACRLRSVRTSSYEPAALVGQPGTEPIDLTHAVLRSVSPVHLEYMRNMGVTASMGISLIVDQRLWGMITCNHESGERLIPYRQRAGCGLIGEVVASLIGQRELLDATAAKLAILSTQASLLQFIAQDRDVVSGLTRHSPSLQDVMNAQGAALLFEDELHCLGQTPAEAEVLELAAWLDTQTAPVVAFESLPAHYAPAHAWPAVGCGLLAARIAFDDSIVVTRRTWLMWFRPEVAQIVSWGGDPNKVATPDPHARLHPRTSFAQWRQVVELQSEPFDVGHITAAKLLVEALGDVIVELAATRKLREAARRLEEANRSLVLQIQETERAEVELRRAQKLEAIGRLAAGVAHEINTPLQFINDSIRYVGEAMNELMELVPDATPGESRIDLDFLKLNLPRAIVRSLGGLERVSRIVAALKEFAQPDTQDKRPTDLNRVLAVTTEIARALIKDHATVTLDLATLPPVPCFVGPLNQLFLGLIVNAAEAIEATLASPRVGGTIAIKSWHDDTNVFVTVGDDGCGIAEPLRESIFLPFFTTKEVGRGTGRGLAASHAIAMKHGGALTFETEVGRGTVFTVRLPM